jgi:hypothetical protein
MFFLNLVNCEDVAIDHQQSFASPLAPFMPLFSLPVCTVIGLSLCC